MLIDVAIPGDRSVITKEAEKVLKYKDLIIKVIPVNRDHWNHFRITQTIPEQRTRQARN
jgi:hypothetical protein